MAYGEAGRVGVTMVGAVASVPASYFFKQVLNAWGVLDPISDAFGKYLKANVPAATAGWTLALIIVLAIYGVILWRVWRPRHIHHLPIQAENKPVASLEVEVIRAPLAQPAPEQPDSFERLLRKRKRDSRDVRTLSDGIHRAKAALDNYKLQIDRFAAAKVAKPNHALELDTYAETVAAELGRAGIAKPDLKIPRPIQTPGVDPHTLLENRALVQIEHNKVFVAEHYENFARLTGALDGAQRRLAETTATLATLDSEIQLKAREG